ncbi:SusC/RagA family TonB-linked outer membrane protein [Sphingobacterium daejeonense]|uniref:SusC/RagA family TonB-linked outer membrane protein n=1 Tax=Sphingobacterium daejeonense TaxID=371142 RepID=UPI0021A30613|nr:SusC/RagA family TonB-linked outer membrane protein [Sphingobacterium daejeonense]MCT1531697.1 SusC/RagA family TonB-linked outer membrane protein [Sphingobacterium daejeonense]
MKNLYYYSLRGIIAIIFLSCFSLASYSQSLIKGAVADQDGNPLEGITVSNQTQSQTTQTDSQGNFSISAKISDVLLFTSIGYESQTVTLENLGSLRIFMVPTGENLDEVVVLGYGSIKKSNLTGSVSRLDKRVLETGVRSNPASALAGTIPGLRVQQTSGRPGAVPNIVLRGGTSYTGGGSPLVIVDGLIRSGFQDINQDDIESIDVLKDASATAIYGARASNGVVLITTKRGKEGVSNITAKAKIGMNSLNIPFDFLNAEDYIYWSRKSIQTSGIYNPTQLNQLTSAVPFGTGNKYKDANGNILDGNVTNQAVWSTMFLDDTNRELLNKGWRTMIDPVTGKEIIFTEFNYGDQALNQNALTQDYNVAMQGGNDKGKYYASLGKYYEEGVPVKTFYDRLTFILNGDYKIKPWLESLSGLNFANTKWRDANNAEANYMTRALGAPPTMRGYNENGDLLIGRDNWDGNVMVNIDKFIRNNENQKLTLSQGFNIKFSEKLNWKSTGSWYLNQSMNEAFNKDYLNSPGNWVRSRNSSAGYDKTLNQTYNSVLNYRDSFLGKHNVDAMLGWEFFDSYNKGLSASGSGAPTDDFMDLALTSVDNLRSIDSYHNRYRINSFFGRINYDYDQKYLLTLTARRDGYSTLLNNRWGTFPGISIGWILHNEEMFSNFIGQDQVVNTLKLRASYGANGDIGPVTANNRGYYYLQGRYGTSNYNGAVGYTMNNPSNFGLKWESLITKEVGLETRLVNRLDLSLAYYHRTTFDKIAELVLPVTAGGFPILTNNGDMQNQGVEIDLNYNILRNSDWMLNFNLNTAYNANKVLKLPNNGVENNRQGGFQVYDPVTKDLIWVGGIQEGQDPNIAYAYQAEGIIRTQSDLDNYALKLKDLIGAKTLVHPDVFEGMSASEKALHYPIALGDVMWKDVNGDGIINSYDQVYQGRTVPRWTGGFGIYSSWKNFSLSTRFDYALGFVQYDGPRAWFMGMMQGTFNTTQDVFDTYTPENTGAKYPTYYFADQLFKNNTSRMSSMFFNRGDYLAWREVSLSYRLPRSIAEKAKLEDLSLSVTGQNLHYWSKSTLFSPESGSIGQGGGGYPLPRTVIFGLQLTF